MEFGFSIYFAQSAIAHSQFPFLMNTLLQQVRLLDPVSGTDKVCDVLLAEDSIQAIEDRISDYPADTSIRDCRGLVLGPGLVDLYSHSGEPGFETRETLESLRQAAMAGGFTRVAILPDTSPPVDNPATLLLLRNSNSQVSPACRLYCWGAITAGVRGQQMTELAELAVTGAIGFADGKPVESLALLRRFLEYVRPLGKPVALWPCDRPLAGNGAMREGVASMRFGLLGNPAISETVALAVLLEMVAAIGTPVHIMRVSTARSVELIREAKNKGLPVTASTTWMHLLLNYEAIAGFPATEDAPISIPYNPSLRLEPPLGTPEDREALIEGVGEGVLEAIAIDHAPHTYEEKTVAFAEAPPGAIGLELALPLLWHAFVETGKWSANRLWRSLSTNPALCLQQEPARVAPSLPLELTLFNPHQTWNVETQTLKSLSANTPWLGHQLKGRIVQTRCS